jgi:CRP/FNR family cyclic AMP-dependent transcriptional regulator
MRQTVLRRLIEGGIREMYDGLPLRQAEWYPNVLVHRVGCAGCQEYFGESRLRVVSPRRGRRVVANDIAQSFDPKSFLAKVGDGRSVEKYGKDQIVFSQGDPADAVFYIRKGKVKVTVVSEQGKEAVVALLGGDDFFGEACLAGQATRIATVAAITESIIVRLERAAIVRLIQTDPAFSELFIAHLLDRTIRVEADLVDQLFNSSEKRLARLLLLLANFGKEGKREPVIAKISQETLAEMIGTTRSRVSFFMNKFRDLGFIDYNGGIAVHSSLLNVVLHDQPHIKT